MDARPGEAEADARTERHWWRTYLPVALPLMVCFAILAALALGLFDSFDRRGNDGRLKDAATFIKPQMDGAATDQVNRVVFPTGRSPGERRPRRLADPRRQAVGHVPERRPERQDGTLTDHVDDLALPVSV